MTFAHDEGSPVFPCSHAHLVSDCTASVGNKEPPSTISVKSAQSLSSFPRSSLHIFSLTVTSDLYCNAFRIQPRKRTERILLDKVLKCYYPCESTKPASEVNHLFPAELRLLKFCKISGNTVKYSNSFSLVSRQCFLTRVSS